MKRFFLIFGVLLVIVLLVIWGAFSFQREQMSELDKKVERLNTSINDYCIQNNASIISQNSLSKVTPRGYEGTVIYIVHPMNNGLEVDVNEIELEDDWLFSTKVLKNGNVQINADLSK